MNIGNNLDTISNNLSKAFQGKFPEINSSHYSPHFIKDYIIKSNINTSSKDGLHKIITGLTNNFNYLKVKMNKERQTTGLVDFDLYSHNVPNNLPNNFPNNFNNSNISNNSNQKPIPQQNLVVKNKLEDPAVNNSRREFLNPKPLIIDSGMVPNINNGINTNGLNMGIGNNINGNKPFLNNIETKNTETSNYQSFPANPSQKDISLSALSNLPAEIVPNQTDRFILTNQQKNLLKEEKDEWAYYLVIDSKDRDINIYKSPNEYTIRFSPPSFSNNSGDARTGFVDKILHNVKSIELIKCGFLDTSSLEDSSDSGGNGPPYVILEVEEFATQHNGTNQYLNKSLAILDTYEKRDNFKYYEVIYNDKAMINRFNPRVSIDKMSIKFRLPNGNLYNFGGVNNTNQTTVNYMVFKVIVLQRTLETQYLNQS